MSSSDSASEDDDESDRNGSRNVKRKKIKQSGKVSKKLKTNSRKSFKASPLIMTPFINLLYPGNTSKYRSRELAAPLLPAVTLSSRNQKKNGTRSQGPHHQHSTNSPGQHSALGNDQEILLKIIEFLTSLPSPYDPSKFNIGSNFYNPTSTNLPPPSGLRPIIIDGSNIAMSHGLSLEYSVRGIIICLEYFLKRGHKQVHAFVPLFRRQLAPHLFNQLEKRGLVIFTPSRWLDTGELVASYDDRFIVQTAVDMGGVIVSKDNFRDLIAEHPDWATTIRERLLLFTWVGDRLIFPIDPLGRKGPSLDEFLRF